MRGGRKKGRREGASTKARQAAGRRRELVAELFTFVDALKRTDADDHLEACETQVAFSTKRHAKRAELAETIVAWEAEVEVADASLLRFRSDRRALRDSFESAQATLRKLRTTRREIERKLEMASAHALAEEEALRARGAELEAERTDLEGRATAAEAEHAASIEQLSASHAKIAQMEADHEAVTGESSALRARAADQERAAGAAVETRNAIFARMAEVLQVIDALARERAALQQSAAGHGAVERRWARAMETHAAEEEQRLRDRAASNADLVRELAERAERAERAAEWRVAQIAAAGQWLKSDRARATATLEQYAAQASAVQTSAASAATTRHAQADALAAVRLEHDVVRRRLVDENSTARETAARMRAELQGIHGEVALLALARGALDREASSVAASTKVFNGSGDVEAYRARADAAARARDAALADLEAKRAAAEERAHGESEAASLHSVQLRAVEDRCAAAASDVVAAQERWQRSADACRALERTIAGLDESRAREAEETRALRKEAARVRSEQGSAESVHGRALDALQVRDLHYHSIFRANPSHHLTCSPYHLPSLPLQSVARKSEARVRVDRKKLDAALAARDGAAGAWRTDRSELSYALEELLETEAMWETRRIAAEARARAARDEWSEASARAKGMERQLDKCATAHEFTDELTLLERADALRGLRVTAQADAAKRDRLEAELRVAETGLQQLHGLAQRMRDQVQESVQQARLLRKEADKSALAIEEAEALTRTLRTQVRLADEVSQRAPAVRRSIAAGTGRLAAAELEGRGLKRTATTAVQLRSVLNRLHADKSSLTKGLKKSHVDREEASEALFATKAQGTDLKGINNECVVAYRSA